MMTADTVPATVDGSAALGPLYDKLLALAPRAALVVALLFGGLVAAWVVRRVAEWLIRRSGIETLSEKVGIAKLLYAVGFRGGVSKAVGSVLWLATLLLTLAAIADVLQLSAVSAAMSLLVRYLPRLLATCAILLGGLSLAAVVRNVVRNTAGENGQVESAGFVAQLCYYVILTISVTWAAAQAGLETDLVRWLVLLVAGLGLGSVALAFGLGARGVFKNIATGHYYSRILRPGDRVQVGEHAGVVTQFTPVALILQADNGQELIIACTALLDEVIVVEALPAPPVAAPSATAEAAAEGTDFID